MDKHAQNVGAALTWWKTAPHRRLLGDHLPLNAVEQARLNGAWLPWPAEYDKPTDPDLGEQK